MTITLIRTVIVYIVLMLSLRIMGKRQIGELELSDFITTLLISEIASLPITNTEIPISRAIIPIVMILIFEVGSSLLLINFPRIKALISTRPSTLIKDGKICQSNLKKSRISNDELISELRQSGVGDFSTVMYAILEQNGKISVIQKTDEQPITRKSLRCPEKESGIFHILIDKGTLNRHALKELSMSKDEVAKLLRKQKCEIKDIYIMLINDRGEHKIVLRDKIYEVKK